MDAKHAKQLSKELSRALRHTPDLYGVKLDREGWVPVNSLLAGMQRLPRWRHITQADIEQVVSLFNKQRYEIAGNQIRALYGHSVPIRIEKDSATPPPILFHGTSQYYAQSILQSGLQPMGRQYVHLSEDIETATNVGLRKGKDLAIFRIDTAKATTEDIRFYYGNDTTWLADSIPPQFISLIPR